MKKLLAITAIALSAGAFTPAEAADKYVFDVTHTNVIWKTDHFGYSAPNGQFAKVEGFVNIDKSTPEKSSAEATIDIKSLWTPTEKFTAHLLNPDFFNSEKFATAKFTSTKVEKTSDNTLKVTGDLNLLGVTKPVVLDVIVNKIGKHPYTQKETAGFSATTTVKRSEFGMSYGIPNVGDEVEISIELEAVKEGDDAAE